ncbi:hypothetical protein AMTR_s00079p00158270 [Amborella trichopoda]|uniref:Uncharacterized protein n=1 Tax=Amborella trichopoda TaxID=13333 RepID=W1P7U1_AMBTC|nr:hypothetical protein AMTR_s00079p00158270 [Amborella trichopoda]
MPTGRFHPYTRPQPRPTTKLPRKLTSTEKSFAGTRPSSSSLLENRLWSGRLRSSSNKVEDLPVSAFEELEKEDSGEEGEA